MSITSDRPADLVRLNYAPAKGLGELSPQQWRSGVAAWLGWLFDGLDMHLYTLVAGPFVAALLAKSMTDPEVAAKSSWIQASFLVGWALGGGLFGRIGDRLGRSRALGLTILTYAAFTGLSFFAQTWWQLMIFRFLAALGIGGEWAVGSALLSETWPPRWRAWVAACLQTAVNIGVLIACGVVYLLADHQRAVFLVGVLPALIVFWIRRAVPEPQAWVDAQRRAHRGVPIADVPVVSGVGDLSVQEGSGCHGHAVNERPSEQGPSCVAMPAGASEDMPTQAWDMAPKASHLSNGVTSSIEPSAMADLFRGPVRGLTLRTIGVCAFSLTAWWGFMFWIPQHMQNLPDVASWTSTDRKRLSTTAFFLVIFTSIAGNFASAALAKRVGYRRAIALMFLGFFLAMAGTFSVPRGHASMLCWVPWIGFFSGVFGLFTMYLPPLFPTLLRTTGAGFSYNIGRLAAAFGTVFFGLFNKLGDFRLALLCNSLLFIPAIAFALTLPDLDDRMPVKPIART